MNAGSTLNHRTIIMSDFHYSSAELRQMALDALEKGDKQSAQALLNNAEETAEFEAQEKEEEGT